MDSSYLRRQSHRHPHPSFAYCSSSKSKILAKAIVGRTCPICLVQIDHRRAAVITTCLHAYCISCIRKWSQLKRKCPICNEAFTSWFFKINLPARTFREQRLPDNQNNVNSQQVYERQRGRLNDRRILRKRKEELNNVRWRTRPLPRQRTFEKPGSAPSDVIAERIMQWRVSVYNRGLQAVPCASRNYHGQNIAGKYGFRERILQRIEPWIRRELQAVLADPDPSVIVHVVTSLFILSIEEKQEVPSGNSVVDNKYLDPLRPFLDEWTNMFWHELRCFAESSLNMETYDAVVEYRMAGSNLEE